jgi:hypothetical protein
MKMLAKKNLVYCGHNIQAGTSFNVAKEADVDILELIGKAERQEEPEIWTKVQTAVEEAVVRTKRRYRRKDMAAE